MYVAGPGSNYNSLQLKYQRQMSRALQALATYTWSHAIDSASQANYANTYPIQRGNSDNDVRNNFTAALVYSLPSNASLWFVARTAFPYEPAGPLYTDPVTGDQGYQELNYNGNPYVYKAGILGGRQIDPT